MQQSAELYTNPTEQRLKCEFVAMFYNQWQKKQSLNKILMLNNIIAYFIENIWRSESAWSFTGIRNLEPG